MTNRLLCVVQIILIFLYVCDCDVMGLSFCIQMCKIGFIIIQKQLHISYTVWYNLYHMYTFAFRKPIFLIRNSRFRSNLSTEKLLDRNNYFS